MASPGMGTLLSFKKKNNDIVELIEFPVSKRFFLASITNLANGKSFGAKNL